MGGQIQYLLDTHALIFWWSGHPGLSEVAKAAITDSEAIILVSPVSAMEIATKNRVGKFPDGAILLRDWDALMRQHRFAELPITSSHARRAGSYDADHKDPFDRLLAAQSELEGAVLLSRDREMSQFPCDTHW